MGITGATVLRLHGEHVESGRRPKGAHHLWATKEELGESSRCRRQLNDPIEESPLRISNSRQYAKRRLRSRRRRPPEL